MTNSDQSAPGEPLSGAPLFTFDADKRIRSWNAAAAALTGVSSEDAIGSPCWDVLCAHDEAGGMVCHAGCSVHRLLVERWPVSPQVLVIKTTDGPRRVQMPMVVLQEKALFAALMLEPGDESGPAAHAADDRLPTLTPRQRTVLGMLAEGKQARAIADELKLSELTVRNHIRAILRELGCRSQIAALAEARRVGLV